MITTILYGLLIVFLVICLGSFSYHIMLKMARQKAERLFQNKNQQITQWQSELKSQYDYFEHIKKIEQNSIAKLKAEIIRKQEQSQEMMKAAEQIRESAARTVNMYEKRISQLQSELYQARKRAERLANKAKSTVQI